MKRLSSAPVVPVYAGLLVVLLMLPAFGCASGANNETDADAPTGATSSEPRASTDTRRGDADPRQANAGTPQPRTSDGNDPRPRRESNAGSRSPGTSERRESTTESGDTDESVNDDDGSEIRLLPVELAEDDPDFACGFATISMIAHYYDRTVPEEIAREIRETVEEYGGLHGDQLTEYLEMLGFHAEPTRGVLRGTSDGDDGEERSRSLLYYLEQERPVVLLMRHRKAIKNHFGVIVGHDSAAGRVALLDPGLGLQWIGYAELETSWAHGSHFMLVPIPAKEIVW